MVLELSIAFAMRCPTCGRLDNLEQLNIFQLSGKQEVTFHCECGAHKATISRQGRSYIAIDYFCIICDNTHSIVLPQKVFWTKNKLNSLFCLDTDLNLAYFGSYHLINKELQRQQQELNSLANDLGFDDFADPEIMLGILDYLHDIAAYNGLFCECGSHNIDIELFPDKLELSCSVCNAMRSIPASKKADLDNIKKLDEIILHFSTSRSKNF